MKYVTRISPNISCPGYNDPRMDVIQDLNRLMVYVGMVAAAEEESVRLTLKMDPSLTFHTTTDGHIEGQHDVFRAHFEWFAAAAVVEIVCVLLILPTYWRFWTLGRQVSFSPLEMAKV